ncbi:MAG: GTPase ObgE [bacterium]|nr:GTPase ObgE [bacterium]
MVKFVDTARIMIQSGKGGGGCASFRREKFIEFGGPNGGDGGRGGSVFIQGDPNLTSLQDLRLNPHQRAGNGQPGMSDMKTGKAGADKIIKLPLGTVICDEISGEIVMEVLDENPELLLKGGRGGLGNIHFKSSTNQAPRYAQPGEPGQEMSLELELKIMADVGLVGFPNAGKSTFISAISAARPKVADYPFTTLVPNLGVVQLPDYRSFVVADIPGIIEGAHEGVGLGDRFLKHIQRTAALAFLLDGSPFAEKAPIDAFKALYEELRLFSEDLLEKKRVVVLTKLDSLDPEFDVEELRRELEDQGETFFVISAVSHQGLEPLLEHLYRLVLANRSV